MGGTDGKAADAVFYAILIVAAAGATGIAILSALQPPSPAAPTSFGPRATKLTSFDISLAQGMMDRNGDGKCDSMGSSVEGEILANRLQCMGDPNATIGQLGSSHHHADFKVYVNGLPTDFNDPKYFVRSSFAHVEPDEVLGATGTVLHLHATGVPLWVFFKSVGMDLDGAKILVNGAESGLLGDYAPSNGDRILVSYGNATQGELKREMDSVTDYAAMGRV